MYEIRDQFSLQDVISIIKKDKFVIYGYGFVGKRFYKQVQRMGYSENVIAIAVTDIGDEKNTDYVTVQSIYDISKESMVFVAVHDASVLDMQEILDKIGIKKYMWVYPYLFDLELGTPICKDKTVCINDLLTQMNDIYMPAIYYLSLKDYCGANIYNGELYIKMSTAYTTLETGKKRWERFCKTIDECRERGFKQDYNIKVDENNLLIDGLHRLVLARYFGESDIICDVYHCDDEFYSEKGVGGSIRINEDELERFFEIEEIRAIQNADVELRR